MAKKNRKNNFMTEGTIAGFAGVIVLFVSAFNPTASSTLAVAFHLGKWSGQKKLDV